MPRRILSYCMFTMLSCWCYGWWDSRPSIQKLELHYGLLDSEKPELQSVWDSYMMFLEMKIVFRNKQRLKDMWYLKEVFCLQVQVKCSTIFKTKMHRIRKNASHVLMVRTYRERTKLKGVMRPTRLGSSGLTLLLKLMFLLRVRELLK